MVDTTAIKANAELVQRVCQPLVDFPFSYDEPSVTWLEGYIERLRASGGLKDNFDTYVSVFGSYLGEAIIASFGGEWSDTGEDSLHIALPGNNKALPFNKVRKQMEDGVDSGESIASFYRMIPFILAGGLTKD
jgi:hypothetical protein